MNPSNSFFSRGNRQIKISNAAPFPPTTKRPKISISPSTSVRPPLHPHNSYRPYSAMPSHNSLQSAQVSSSYDALRLPHNRNRNGWQGTHSPAAAWNADNFQNNFQFQQFPRLRPFRNNNSNMYSNMHPELHRAANNWNYESNQGFYGERQQPERYYSPNQLDNSLNSNSDTNIGTYHKRKRMRRSNSEIVNNQKKKKKKGGQTNPARPWNRLDAQVAINTELAYRVYDGSKQLIIRFPDEEINSTKVRDFSPQIKYVHFAIPCTPRFCVIQLEEDANVEEVIEQLNKTPFQNGFLRAELKPQKEDMPMNPENVDPYALYVGNLPYTITSSSVKEKFPKAIRIDIGYAQKVKFTRYAFVKFLNVQDAVEAYIGNLRTVFDEKSVVLRFLRSKGTAIPPGTNCRLEHEEVRNREAHFEVYEDDIYIYEDAVSSYVPQIVDDDDDDDDGLIDERKKKKIKMEIKFEIKKEDEKCQIKQEILKVKQEIKNEKIKQEIKNEKIKQEIKNEKIKQEIKNEKIKREIKNEVKQEAHSANVKVKNEDDRKGIIIGNPVEFSKSVEYLLSKRRNGVSDLNCSENSAEGQRMDKPVSTLVTG